MTGVPPIFRPVAASVTASGGRRIGVERLARERGLPVSAWLAEAAQEALRHQAALAAIDEITRLIAQADTDFDAPVIRV